MSTTAANSTKLARYNKSNVMKKGTETALSPLQATNREGVMIGKEYIPALNMMEAQGSQAVLTWKQAVSSFVVNSNTKPSSRLLYTRTLKLFFEWAQREGKSLHSLTGTDILSYMDYLKLQGKTSLTICSYLTSLRSFYEWAEREKLYPNIVKGIKSPKRKNKFVKQHLTDGKSGELLQYFQERSLRDYAIVNLILRTGLRTIEVVRADVGDITYRSFEDKNGKEVMRRVLRVWGKGKEEKDDFVILTDKAFNPLKDYLSTRPKAKDIEPLFVSDCYAVSGERLSTRTISGICKSGLKAIGLDSSEYTAHSLRHTTATTILKHGGSLDEAQAVLRHTSPETTQIYLESIKDESRLERNTEGLLDEAF